MSKEGVGLKKVWQQQFQQFRNVSADMAAAIVAVYPTPQSLLQVLLDLYGFSVLFSFFFFHFFYSVDVLYREFGSEPFIVLSSFYVLNHSLIPNFLLNNVLSNEMMGVQCSCNRNLSNCELSPKSFFFRV